MIYYAIIHFDVQISYIFLVETLPNLSSVLLDVFEGGLTLYIPRWNRPRLAHLFTCSEVSAEIMGFPSEPLQVFRLFPEQDSVVSWPAWGELAAPLGTVPSGTSTQVPWWGLLQKEFPIEESGNGLLNFWLLSETGFLSQLIEHKLQLTLEGLTCILRSF